MTYRRQTRKESAGKPCAASVGEGPNRPVRGLRRSYRRTIAEIGRSPHVGAPQGANTAVPNATTAGEHPSTDVRGLRRSYRGPLAEIRRGAL